ncbi:DUF1572 family protein [Maribacter sp.]|uniref:DUF1572 family protein n=1 Tax=Maribacter sp. TaxID=1897614 RepID=UPI0025B96E57|nr:DUF1572 family protein [Maribacter sp.]
MDFTKEYLHSVMFEFKRYKTLGDTTFSQLSEEEIQWTYQKNENSISQIVKHIVGNMHSRWTNFLTEDGEKTWRNRDEEFINSYTNKKEMLTAWEKGWQCLFNALETLNENNFTSTVYIRNEEHSIPNAINRQLAHYSYHVGQLVLIGKMLKGEQWISLSILKGESEAFNALKFNS